MSGIKLYEDRTEAEQTALLLAGPIALGVVTGFALGLSEIAYLVLSLVGIIGGYFAGLEHDSPREGFHRGLVGGMLFGVTILLTHGLTGREAQAELPDPEILVVVITTVFGVVLGTLGARSRRKKLARS